MFRQLLAIPLALGLAACATVPPHTASAPPPDQPVTVRIVGINDFHGNLEPLKRPLDLTDGHGGEQTVYAGGAAWFASAVEKTRAQNKDSMVIAAGDLISASPLISSLFLDEPTIGVMNRIGLEYSAVGNHEFDRGWKELKRLQMGGCEKNTLRQPCAVENPYKGAQFEYLAANVEMPDGSTLFPAYAIKRFGSGPDAIAIGVIGLTLRDTANIVSPTGVKGLTFTDEATAINKAVATLETKDVDAIVVAIHQGLVPEPGADFTGCGAISGGLRPILERLDPRVNLVISGHTHRNYVCNFATVDPSRPFIVSQAGYGGTEITDIAMTIDPAKRTVLSITAKNIPVQSPSPAAGPERPLDPNFAAFSPDPKIAAYVAQYAAAARDVTNRPVGKVSGPALKRGYENPLGDLIADAQLAATKDAGAQVAFMNPGGIRSDLMPAADGSVTFGDIYAVQPFGNTLVTENLTGKQLLAMLEQQYANPDGTELANVMSVSKGFTMTLDPSKPIGQRVVSAALGGEPIDPAATYRVTMNSFLASGGDGFTVFEQGTDPVVGPLDVDAMEAYLETPDGKARQLPAGGRVTVLGQ
ncbi:bifunctional metallophosphatase/5'-nucleotidase [Tsuneonella mangrovi]|uniref:bifunctional metallophosphatase/5'-nucleotidase n=1 Tax=Tsuneonella mangrovi TaxID=1982042 RepID=UPI000BA1D32A|nr:bifunctional metallophosphatase/5'-nucleotidase [Tsuneonella mangrovi]